MFMFSILRLFVIYTVVFQSTGEVFEEEEIQARSMLEEINSEINQKRYELTESTWAFHTNITNYNLQKYNEKTMEISKYTEEIRKELFKYNFTNYQDKDLKRQFVKMIKLGSVELNETQNEELLSLMGLMSTNFATAKVCSYGNNSKCDLSLDPDVTEIMSKSRDPEELKHYWIEWYNKAGTPTKQSFVKYVELTNAAAQLNNYSSVAELWLSEYEDETFEEQLENIIKDFSPFYKQLHAYMRFKLREYYGDIVSENGPIPMHLLGNMWGEVWDNVADITSPYPNKALIDISDEMLAQEYTPLKMFEMGDEFFQSLNMSSLTDTFWNKSIIEKPTDGREFVCHPTSWDFFKEDDFRIKQCTKVGMEQLFIVHHELGHIQYFMQYQHLPTVYRDGANPGFHEAVGDVLALSVSTPKHLQRIGLLKNYVEDEEVKINQIYRAGLMKLIVLPYVYSLDKYRWSIFRGEITPDEYNCMFWKIREQYSGIEPPVIRSEKDFDAPAKYHISAHTDMVRYLVSYIIQFQFHKAACTKAGEYIPGDPEKNLNNCDIYQSIEAGNALKEMLSMGSSKPWPDAMEILTGQRKIDIGPLLEYFKPLQDWLEIKNRENGVSIGWTASDKCVSTHE